MSALPEFFIQLPIKSESSLQGIHMWCFCEMKRVHVYVRVPLRTCPSDYQVSHVWYVCICACVHAVKRIHTRKKDSHLFSHPVILCFSSLPFCFVLFWLHNNFFIGAPVVLLALFLFHIHFHFFCFPTLHMSFECEYLFISVCVLVSMH